MDKTDEAEATKAPAKGPRQEARNRKRSAAQLESQDDLAYVTGEHDEKEAEKQIKSPTSRRQSNKAKEASRAERR